MILTQSAATPFLLAEGILLKAVAEECSIVNVMLSLNICSYPVFDDSLKKLSSRTEDS